MRIGVDAFAMIIVNIVTLAPRLFHNCWFCPIAGCSYFVLESHGKPQNQWFWGFFQWLKMEFGKLFQRF